MRPPRQKNAKPVEIDPVRVIAASPGLAEEIRAIGTRCAELPVLDPRTADEILEYDDDGLPNSN